MARAGEVKLYNFTTIIKDASCDLPVEMPGSYGADTGQTGHGAVPVKQ